jgi:hypothetical protein
MLFLGLITLVLRGVLDGRLGRLDLRWIDRRLLNGGRLTSLNGGTRMMMKRRIRMKRELRKRVLQEGTLKQGLKGREPTQPPGRRREGAEERGGREREKARRGGERELVSM